jgi:predicted nucleotidyltransferase
MSSIDEIKEKIQPIAMKYDIPAVYIFGSYARGEAEENSDVDMVISDENSKISDLMSFIRVENELEAALGRKVDLLTMYQVQEEKKSLNRYFIENYNKEKILVYEKQ